VFRLLTPETTASSDDVYSYKFILDCVKQNKLLDISTYRLVKMNCILGISLSCISMHRFSCLTHATDVDECLIVFTDAVCYWTFNS